MLISRLYIVLLLLVGSSFFVASCTDKDVGKIYFNSEVSNPDSPTLSIILNTLNDDDKEAIFSVAKNLIVSVDGFIQQLDLRLAFSSVGGVYVSLPFKVFPNKSYIVKKAYLIDGNGTIVGVAPITGSLWSYSVTSPLPYAFQAEESGNTNANLTFLPAVNADVELTGYDYRLSPSPTLPSLKFQLEIRDDGDKGNFIVSSVTIKRKANGTVVRTQQISNTGIYTIEDLYYYDPRDVFVFEVDGYTKQGYKKTTTERTANFLFESYDKRNQPYQIYL